MLIEEIQNLHALKSSKSYVELSKALFEIDKHNNVLVVDKKRLLFPQIEKLLECASFNHETIYVFITDEECWEKMSRPQVDENYIAPPKKGKGIPPEGQKKGRQKKGRQKNEVLKKPKISLKNFKSLLSALITGEHVPKEQQEKRLEICHGCEKFVNRGAKSSCGVCGCKLEGSSKILSLTSYVETDKYGCKHPKGSRWKENGV